MNNEMEQVLKQVQEGTLSVEDAMLKIKSEPFVDIDYAKVDLHRRVRQGANEVIYGAGKTPEQIAGILQVMERNAQGNVLITRMSETGRGGNRRHERYSGSGRGCTDCTVPWQRGGAAV